MRIKDDGTQPADPEPKNLADIKAALEERFVA